MKISFLNQQEKIESIEVNPSNYFIPQQGDYIILNQKRCRIIDVQHHYEIHDSLLLNQEIKIVLEVFDKE